MDAKSLRKQIRNVIQEIGRDILTSELGTTLHKKLEESLNARLDQIDKYCQNALEKQAKKTQGVLSFIIQEVKGKISNDLYNANLTIDATVAVLAEAGLPIEDFNTKVDAKKVALDAEKKKSADEKMKAEMEKRVEDAKAADAAQAPAAQ